MRIKVWRADMAAAAAAMVCLGLAAGVTAPPAALAAGGGRVALPSPVPAWPETLTDLGPAGPDMTASVPVYLAGRSPAAETRFAAAVSTPGNPMYGRYLTPAQFWSRFGPATAETAAISRPRRRGCIPRRRGRAARNCCVGRNGSRPSRLPWSGSPWPGRTTAWVFHAAPRAS
jgi:hypothetical protein